MILPGSVQLRSYCGAGHKPFLGEDKWIPKTLSKPDRFAGGQRISGWNDNSRSTEHITQLPSGGSLYAEADLGDVGLAPAFIGMNPPRVDGLARGVSPESMHRQAGLTPGIVQ